MADVIQVLHLEDSAADRELVRELLAGDGLECQITPARTEEEFSSFLHARKWDIILADFALPGFDGTAALSIARKLCPRTPFIFLSGVMGEEIGVESLKCGATDYVWKQRMKRLCPAVRRALKDLEIEAQLEATRAHAISSDRLSALGLMAGNIAHEINNPLAIIHAYASDLLEMAESGNVPLGALQSAGTRIKHTADRITRIVKSLRQIARDGSADPFQLASVCEIVEQSLELCRDRFRVHSVRLDVPTIDPGVHISCREGQIAQVLLNLLQNALDAVVECQGDRWVRLEVGSDERSVVFAVLDSGPGVPLDVRSRIMEPFFTTKPAGKGTGLGLSVSKAIVEDHGGELTFCERERHTCFSFSLPLSKESENAVTECLNSRCG